MLRTKNHGRRTADGTRRTDIWITKSLPELSSGETKIHCHPIKCTLTSLPTCNHTDCMCHARCAKTKALGVTYKFDWHGALQTLQFIYIIAKNPDPQQNYNTESNIGSVNLFKSHYKVPITLCWWW